MSLTSDEIAFVATRANCYFDVLYPQTGANGDWTIFTGDGLADINRFIGRFEATPNLRVMVDVGTLSTQLKTAGLQDFYDIRTVFVATYGSVNQVSPFPPGQEIPTVFETGTKWLQNPQQPLTEVT